ncbi:MAG: catalase family peroxidase [Xanthobacteraceae bacterium]|nr:catalase family peroxidase [Xanthobacteraceae bacterium]
MSTSNKSPGTFAIGSLALIAVVVGGTAGAFAYTAGWLSPDRLTSTKLLAAFGPVTKETLGHRRNHAKGVCFTGVFESNGDGAALSRAEVFSKGQYPALGRFNLGTTNPDASDLEVRVRGLGLQISTPDGGVWRSAMINAPIFAVSTPNEFYELLNAAASKAADAMKNFAAAHPEFGPFGKWATTSSWTPSYAEEPYNGLNAFAFSDKSGTEHAVRWSLTPQSQVTPITKEDFDKLGGPNYLEQDITQRVAKEPQRWTMTVTVANAGDPTADPTKAWPDDRRKVEVGTLIIQKIEPEADGPCRNITFDPTILPDGIKVSDDPFPAARSAAYAKSYDARVAESKYYPHTQASKP